MKVESLLSHLHPGSTISETFILACVVGKSGTTHEYAPVAGVELIIVVQLVPLSVEYSNLTLLTDEELYEYVMFWVVPVIHICPLFGDSKIREPLIVKVELLTSLMLVLRASTTLIKQFVEFKLGNANQVNVPAVVLYEVAIAIYELPLSVE